MPSAITPYNFVPLPERVLPAETHDWPGEGDRPYPRADRYHEGLHTGWLEVELTALTPIYTRGVDPDHPDVFFRRPNGGPYVLPGSGLRGMVRSLFEIMTQSSLEFVTRQRLFYRSFAAAAGNLRDLYDSHFDSKRLIGGELRENNGAWELLVADVRTSHTDRTCRRGFVALSVADSNLQSVADVDGCIHRDLYDRSGNWRSSPSTYSAFEYRVDLLGPPDVTLLKFRNAFRAKQCTVSASGRLTGWVIVPGVMIRPKHYWQVILKPDPDTAKGYPIDPQVIEDYLAWGDMAHGKRFGTFRAPRRLQSGSPAFALLDTSGNISVIGANMMMALRYENSIADVAGRSARSPLPEGSVDMAQAVFGRVRDLREGEQQNERTDQIRSRVFFEDAVWVDRGEARLHPNRPDRALLLGPKPTAFQVYLKQPDPGSPVHWDNPNAELAGRKLYWHRSPDAAVRAMRDSAAGQRDDLTTGLQPLRPGTTFQGRVRFENLTDAELGALFAAIQLPNGLAHKFGMGKSLGLGSLRVKVTEVRLFDPRQRFASLDPNAGILPDGKAWEKLQIAYSAFVQRVAPGADTLWGSGRMKTLAALLTWEGRPEDAKTAQVGLNDQWKHRWTLPQPRQLATLQMVTDVLPVTPGSPSGDAERPEHAPSAPTGHPQGERREPPRSRERQPSPPKLPQMPAYRQGDKLTCRVVERKSSGEVVVELPDGSRATAEQAYSAAVGETYRFKVAKVGGDGKVKSLRPC